MGKYLRIFTVILTVIQFISIYFSAVPLFTTLCFLFTAYCCFSMFFVVSKYKYFTIRNHIRDIGDSEFNIGFRLFSMEKVMEKNNNGFYHYVVLGVRYDVSNSANGGGVLYNSLIPTDQFPLFVNFDMFISPVNPETFVVKNKDRRPRLIKNIFSKTYIHIRKIEKEKDSCIGENKDRITSSVPYVEDIDIHYNFTIYPIHENSLNKELSNKIREEIKNYITSKKFLKDEFSYLRN